MNRKRNDMVRDVHNLDEKLSAFLSHFGFLKSNVDISRDSFEIVYRKESLYIKVYGGISTLDYPYYVNVILGDGRSDYPFCDKNAVPLWRLMNEADGMAHREYDFAVLQTQEGLQSIANDLARYAAPFLHRKAGTDHD
jgi:hypothetical protein